MVTTVTTVTTKSWQTDVIDQKGLVIVDLWTPWCGPCRMLTPVIEEVASENTNITVCKLNTDDEPDIPKKFNVMGIPCLLFFKDGKKLEQSVGVMGKDEIQKRIDGFI